VGLNFQAEVLSFLVGLCFIEVLGLSFIDTLLNQVLYNNCMTGYVTIPL
jgi:hypothetical protein